MAITFDNTASGQAAAPTQLNFNHTNAGNYLLVFTICHSLVSVSGVTFNGVSMSNPGDELTSGTFRMDCWYLKNPAIGTFAVVVTFATPVVDGLAISVSYNNVLVLGNQIIEGMDGVTGDHDGGNGGNSTIASFGLVGLEFNNDMVVQAVFSSITATDIVPNGGAQNERSDLTQSTVRLEVNDQINPNTGNFTPACTVGNGVWLTIEIPLMPIVKAPSLDIIKKPTRMLLGVGL